MANFQRITLKLSEAAISKIGRKTRRINKIIESKLKQYNLAQVNSGLDTRGKRIPKLSRLYRKRKSNARTRNAMIRSNHDSKTEYAATGSPNYARLSGQTFEKLKFRVTSKIRKTTVVLKISWTFGNRRRLVGWLSEIKRFYYGLPTGSKSRARLNKILETEIKKALK